MTVHAGLLTVIVPIHNEAAIVEDAVTRLREALAPLGVPIELLLCENGSTDETPAIIERLRVHPDIRVERLAKADYGLALKHGVAVARGDRVVIVNLDFWNIPFMERALQLLGDHDLVLGSKVKGDDRRPLIRRLITRNFNRLLRLVFGFHGTDTHGLKAFRREPVAAVSARCETDGWIYDTELVIRAERAGLRIAEVPVSVAELRAPSYGSLLRRVPITLANLVRLAASLRQPERRAGARDTEVA
jgi:glycosyltransferase involved in cell wall biosynthesis